MRLLLRASLVASVALLAVGSVARAAEPATEMPYLSLYRDVVRDAMARKPPRTPKPADMISIAYAAWLVGERTTESHFHEYALEGYDRFLALEAAREERDFHLTRPFGLLTLALADANELTGDRRAEAHRRVESFLAWFVKRYAVEEKWFDFFCLEFLSLVNFIMKKKAATLIQMKQCRNLLQLKFGSKVQTKPAQFLLTTHLLTSDL
jgi:hypothetical protein